VSDSYLTSVRENILDLIKFCCSKERPLPAKKRINKFEANRLSQAVGPNQGCDAVFLIERNEMVEFSKKA
jgi:hypothetical protein